MNKIYVKNGQRLREKLQFSPFLGIGVSATLGRFFTEYSAEYSVSVVHYVKMYHNKTLFIIIPTYSQVVQRAQYCREQ